MAVARASVADVVLGLVGDVAGTLDPQEFRLALLDALRRAVPSDWISLNEVGEDPETTFVLIEPPFPPAAHELFGRLAHQNPLLARYQRTLDGMPYRLSDVIARAELHALALYREFYGPLGLEHQVAFTLAQEPGRVLAIALSRREQDFAEVEVEVLRRARPFLIQAYRNAGEHTWMQAELRRARGAQMPPAGGALGRALSERGLTIRECEVLRWVAAGRSDGEIAGELGISARTVQKHLQRSFHKLSVRGRSDAARVVWSLA